MEKHMCKLCFKKFANGRALGGHMRSHMMNLPIHKPPTQLGNQLDSVSGSLSLSSTSSSEDENINEEVDEKGLLLSYMLRENPKKSFRLADQEFSFTGSVILDQDRESETESSKNPTRRRSKRIRLSKPTLISHCQETNNKVIKCDKLSESSSVLSDTTTEEDVAFCLMMLSRDKWMDDEENQDGNEVYPEDDEDEEEDIQENFATTKKSSDRVKGKYICETCDKTFKTYQALGGHRASHKKIKLSAPISTNANTNNKDFDDRKVHECPVCYRVFSSGQALGGHKRSHMIGPTTIPATENIATPVEKKAKFGEIMIDLNLPAPIDDDEVSQVENF